MSAAGFFDAVSRLVAENERLTRERNALLLELAKARTNSTAPEFEPASVSPSRNKSGSNFGEALERLRLNAGLTQSELAERCGVSQTTISRAERAATMAQAGRRVSLFKIIKTLAPDRDTDDVLKGLVTTPEATKGDGR